jgi:hypothetical protein
MSSSSSVPGRVSAVVRLHPRTIEQLAARTAMLVAEQLEQGRQRQPELLTAAQVSAWWGLTRRWIYLHSEELGAIPVGGGERPRLRFEAEKVIQRLGRQPNRELS